MKKVTIFILTVLLSVSVFAQENKFETAMKSAIQELEAKLQLKLTVDNDGRASLDINRALDRRAGSLDDNLFDRFFFGLLRKRRRRKQEPG